MQNDTDTAVDGQTRIVFLPPPALGPIDTSKEAARSLPPKWLNQLRQEVYNAIVSSGRSGMTADEAAASLGRSINTVRPRLTELLQAGLIQRSGDRRKTESGRNAHVMVLSQYVDSQGNQEGIQ